MEPRSKSSAQHGILAASESSAAKKSSIGSGTGVRRCIDVEHWKSVEVTMTFIFSIFIIFMSDSLSLSTLLRALEERKENISFSISSLKRIFFYFFNSFHLMLKSRYCCVKSWHSKPSEDFYNPSFCTLLSTTSTSRGMVPSSIFLSCSNIVFMITMYSLISIDVINMAASMLIANNESPKFFPDFVNFRYKDKISFGFSVSDGSLNVKYLVASINEVSGPRTNGQSVAVAPCIKPALVSRHTGQSYSLRRIFGWTHCNKNKKYEWKIMSNEIWLRICRSHRIME